MIISCPKCKVKFKINDNKIPSSGRLVQCSKCSHKWQALGKAEISSGTGKIIYYPSGLYSRPQPAESLFHCRRGPEPDAP